MAPYLPLPVTVPVLPRRGPSTMRTSSPSRRGALRRSAPTFLPGLRCAAAGLAAVLGAAFLVGAGLDAALVGAASAGFPAGFCAGLEAGLVAGSVVGDALFDARFCPARSRSCIRLCASAASATILDRALPAPGLRPRFLERAAPAVSGTHPCFHCWPG